MFSVDSPPTSDTPLRVADLTRFYPPNSQELGLVEGEYSGVNEVYIRFARAYSQNCQQMDSQKTPESYEKLCDILLVLKF
ncbi:4709_t:CDS:2 [Acaulospora colombiana]|uniref:4709_t:CDS:1 n=1 Tax=Acaulospora colombiana TaxID=27376 RepID=A0ACA9MJT4_9GLOM|nr:4709_t:CDS:2 [Acaulospora colombiana]